jgi:hypothetical protein
MFHRWAALLLVLALCAMSPKNAAGQSQPPPRGQKAVRAPHPNPFNPWIHIPFPVADSPSGGCADSSRLNVVTVRISNILSQEVAIPVLEDGSLGGTTSVPTSLIGTTLSNTKLVCGDYQAFWSGFVKNSTTKEAASGTYLVQVFVNGKPTYSVRILNRK